MAKHKRTDRVHRKPRKGRRRNKAQRRSEITSERRHQRAIGKGKAIEKGRQRWFTLDDEDETLIGFERDGDPESPYRASA